MAAGMCWAIVSFVMERKKTNETLLGQIPTLDLTGIGRLGEALAKWDDQFVFVFGGIPDEQVTAEIISRRRRFLFARVTEVLNPSPHRVSPVCPYFGDCTGCQWQHIDYSHQLTLKREAVLDAMRRAGEFESAPVQDVVPAIEQYDYRNHARFTIGPNGTLGFVNRETRRFVLVERCLIMHRRINEMLASLQGKCDETTQLSIRFGVNTDDYLVQPTLKNTGIPFPTGQTHYEEALNGRRFRVASPSFFQVNTRQAERIVGLVKEGLGLDGSEFLIDAYAGVGTFAVLLAQHVERVTAIEDSAAAVEDAEANSQGIPNVQFVVGKTEEVLSSLDERPDVVIVDPPRKGCHPAALDALKKIAPSKLAYVSCDPTTLARDLNSLCAETFQLVSVQPVDMFPQTHHVECVAFLNSQR